MPTFVLKKYQEKLPTQVADTPDENQTQKPEKELEKTIEISVSDSISKIVAIALYRALPNNVEIEEKIDNTKTVQAISTEDINGDPTIVNKVQNNGSLFIMAEHGFTTQKEDWFLSTLTNKNVKTFFSMESFMKSIRADLGL